MGSVLSISVTSNRKGELVFLDKVLAVVYQGLEGDRYRNHSGNIHEPNLRAVTFIEIEKLREYEREFGYALSHGDTRRNLLTEGVDLNLLVDQEFKVGEVLFKGTEWCEPCAYLAKRTHHGLLKGLLNKGGLRAQILQGGIILKGDSITTLD